VGESCQMDFNTTVMACALKLPKEVYKGEDGRWYKPSTAVANKVKW